MRKIIILGLVLFSLAILVNGETSSSSINWLSKTRADSLYCALNDCGGGGAEAGTFLGLNDTLTSYAGQAGNCVIVNSTEDGLIFGACGTGTGDEKWLLTDPWIFNNSDSLDFNKNLLNSTINKKINESDIDTNCTLDLACEPVTYDSELAYINNCSVDMSCDTIFYDSEVANHDFYNGSDTNRSIGLFLINATVNRSDFWDGHNTPYDISAMGNFKGENVTLDNLSVIFNVSAFGFSSREDIWCNGTNCYSIADFLLDTDTTINNTGYVNLSNIHLKNIILEEEFLKGEPFTWSCAYNTTYVLLGGSSGKNIGCPVTQIIARRNGTITGYEIGYRASENTGNFILFSVKTTSNESRGFKMPSANGIHYNATNRPVSDPIATFNQNDNVYFWISITVFLTQVKISDINLHVHGYYNEVVGYDTGYT